ncbi:MULTISPECIES: hypothetical protein [unclassified Mycobacterium]|uniref:hypothetical protein n=1 Tax=unclassified Mycobacterium TaxID=2642494 RepID=UPI0029C761DE|nr:MULTISPECIES: hypothetical protein [unclassified Mycobacterium]
MTMSAPQDPWDEDIQPVDPEQLPPGFYFAPGQEPKPKSSGLSSGLKWALLVIAVVVVVVAVVIAVLVSGGSSSAGAASFVSPAASHSFLDTVGA